jgi:hypothetical protein
VLQAVLQADVLERIASVADDRLDKWELSVTTLARHLLLHLQQLDSQQAGANRSRGSDPGALDALGEAALRQRILDQLKQLTHVLGEDVLAAAKAHADASLAVAYEAALAGRQQLGWAPVAAEDTQSHAAAMHGRAAFVASLALLSSAFDSVEVSRSTAAALYATSVDAYRQLCRRGFRATAVLALADLLATGVSGKLPPELIEDAATVCVGAPRNGPSGLPAAGEL